MGFIVKKQREPDPHTCPIPKWEETYLLGSGSMWQCDECGKIYTLQVRASRGEYGGTNHMYSWNE